MCSLTLAHTILHCITLAVTSTKDEVLSTTVTAYLEKHAMSVITNVRCEPYGQATGNDGGYVLDHSPLERALWDRFSGEEGKDELATISEHGCSGGVGGFIYTDELDEFFDEHESDIEDVLQELGVRFSDLVEDEESWTFQEMKERSVWIVVEE